MKNIFKILFLSAIMLQLVSCSKSDTPADIYVVPYAEQYPKDLDSIEKFLTTHTLDANNEFVSIEVGGTETPIMDMPNLTFKDVSVNDVDYKVYYLLFNEGDALVGERPSRVDSVLVSYKGQLLDKEVFDYAPNPIWLTLDVTVRGFSEIMTKFKTGTFTENTDGTVSYQNYGSGIMFIPSGLAYYNTSTASIPAYSPLIFTFNLNRLNYVDNDRDRILSKDELWLIEDEELLDTDGDGIPNYADVDDDGDGVLTKTEIISSAAGVTPVTYYSFDNIPTCSGGTIKKHLDPTCH